MTDRLSHEGSLPVSEDALETSGLKLLTAAEVAEILSSGRLLSGDNAVLRTRDARAACADAGPRRECDRPKTTVSEGRTVDHQAPGRSLP